MAKIKKFFMMQVTTIVVGVLVLTATALLADWVNHNTDPEYTLGNVGIGTPSPIAKLHVRENALFTNYGTNAGQSYVPSTPILTVTTDGDGAASSTYKNNAVFKVGIGGGDTGNVITEHFRVNLNGNVGIGTTTPNAKLHVRENVLFTNQGTNAGESYVPNTAVLTVTTDGDGTAASTYRNNAVFKVGIGGGDSGSVITEHFRINLDGKIGIGTPSPDTKLHVNGTIKSANYTCASDARYKHSVTPISHALQKLMGLNGVFYSWRTEKFKDMNFSKERQLGFIAQEVEKVIPELVYTDSKGYKSLSYNKLTAVIVEAMKELKTENDRLKKKVASLERMSDRIAALEKMLEGKRVVLR